MGDSEVEGESNRIRRGLGGGGRDRIPCDRAIRVFISLLFLSLSPLGLAKVREREMAVKRNGSFLYIEERLNNTKPPFNLRSA